MTKLAVVERLAEKIRRLEVGARAKAEPRISCGVAVLDALLPEGGLRRGTLVDWIAPAAGAGAGTLALLAARSAAADGGLCVVVDPTGEFYPPAAAGLRLELNRLVWACPASPTDLVWTLEQALRSPGVAAVYAPVGRLSDQVCRRLQLSAEAGGALGLFVRPAVVARQPVWADVRLWIEPLRGSAPTGRRLRVQRLAGRGPAAAVSLEVEFDDETGDVRLAAPMAAAAAGARGAGRRQAG